MKRTILRVALFGATLALTPAFLSGCSGDGSARHEAVGKVDLMLTGTSASGKLYRLRTGVIKITGTAAATVNTEDNLTVSSVALELKAGAYLAKLNPGWTMERAIQGGMGTFEPVKAVLVSANPLPFEVEDQLTTHVRLQFNAGDEVVELGNGRAIVEIGVNDCIGAAAAECDLDGDGVTGDLDCDDQNPEVFPGAFEQCDGIDNDCNGEVDEGSACGCFPGDPLCDLDGDGFPAFDDCNDFDPSVFPGAFEDCDGQDNDCNGLIDENGVCGCTGCDQDGDGFPAFNDCNDFNASIFPGAAELCDSQDNNCDGLIDENGVCGGGGACSFLTQTGCPAGLACYPATPFGDVTVCLPPGNLPAGAFCFDSRQCTPGSVCTFGGSVAPPQTCQVACDPAAPNACLPFQACFPEAGISICF